MGMSAVLPVRKDPSDLRSIFPAECIEMIDSGTIKSAVIEQLVSSVARAGRLRAEDVPEVVAALLERERNGTTALGKGLAFPHLRSRAAHQFAGAIGIAQAGVDFQSLDRTPTRLILMLISPFEERDGHRLILGRLATLLSDKTLQYMVQLPRGTDALFHLIGI